MPVPSVRPARRAATVVAAAVVAAVTAASLSAAPASGAAAVEPPPPTLSTDVVASGLVVPWDVGFLPDGRMVVTEREGKIHVYASGSPGAELERSTTVPSVRVRTDANVAGEGGVLGLAVDTDFASHPYLYVCASRDYAGSGGWVNEVLRYRVGSTGGLSGLTVLLSGMAANKYHNGCALEMDESGHLWVGMGDAQDTALAQDRSSLNGKILRMTRTGGVPADNPEIDGVRDVVYTMGHRNPQGIAFEPGTGRVYSVEHGPNVDDEVNLLVPGGNYGWPCFTGDGTSGPAPEVCEGPAGEPADPADYLPAAWASGASTIATSGGGFVTGEQWGGYEGDLFVATLKEQDLRRLDVDGSGGLTESETMYDTTFGRLRAAVPGPGGRLYTTTSNGVDRVVRISPETTSVHRTSGADRFEVAADVSAATHPSGADDVVVATGVRYPDALTGSAAGGGLGMPVLLTRVDTLPDTTRTELERLAPKRIWVLGGPASVSDAVFGELEGLASEQAERLGGADRYEVASRVSQRLFADPSAVDTVFIASGDVFADALAAAPAAAVSGAPVLLVKRGSIPAATSE
jgi:glucose/arabinose dehydrogenase